VCERERERISVSKNYVLGGAKNLRNKLILILCFVDRASLYRGADKSLA